MSSSATASRNFVPRSLWLGCAHGGHSDCEAIASKVDVLLLGSLDDHGLEAELHASREGLASWPGSRPRVADQAHGQSRLRLSMLLFHKQVVIGDATDLRSSPKLPPVPTPCLSKMVSSGAVAPRVPRCSGPQHPWATTSIGGAANWSRELA